MRILCKINPDKIQNPSERKKVLWFCWNLAHLKFTINHCVEYSSFGETTFLWEWNSISSLRFGKNFTKDFHVKKKILWFCWNLTHIKFTIFKCAQFSTFGETTFLLEWNSISSLRFGKFFTKDFYVKNFPREFLVLWTKIKIKGNSFVFALLARRVFNKRQK